MGERDDFLLPRTSLNGPCRTCDLLVQRSPKEPYVLECRDPSKKEETVRVRPMPNPHTEGKVTSLQGLGFSNCPALKLES